MPVLTQRSTSSNLMKISMSDLNTARYSAARVRGVALHRCVDHSLRNARIHVPRCSVPTQNRIAVLAEMLAMRIEQRTLAGVGRTRTQQHAAGYRRHAGTQRVDHLDVGLGTGFVGDQNASSSSKPATMA